MIIISTQQFVKAFCDIHNNDDRRFCFVLGAGASKSSGIRTGAELARDWLSEIKNDLGYTNVDYQQFIVDKEINESCPGNSYPIIYDERFKIDSETGFHRINNEMEVATPGYGYSVLSQILSEHRHNIIITTNFDTLSEEALYTYTSKRPLVCGHELLADFAKPSINRPLIIKIHRDRFLGPKSRQEETEKISKQWVNALNNIFLNCIPVFIGYGGNDGSLMNYLLEIKQFSNIFWCEMRGAKLAEPVIELLEKHSGKLVEIDGFDELMFWLQDGLNLPVLNKRIETVARERSEKYWDVFKQIKDKYAESTDTESIAAAERLVEKVDDDSWWKWQLQIDMADTIEEKEKIYQEALDSLPNSTELNNNYGVFLENDCHQYDKAEIYYLKTLELDPYSNNGNGNYAHLLGYHLDRHEEAEIFYNKAIEYHPQNANLLSHYALFQKEIHRNIERAEMLLTQALSIDPNNLMALGNYATLYHVEYKDYNNAKLIYETVLKLYPNDSTNMSNYAALLRSIYHDNENADLYYQKAIDLDPKNVGAISNYANFLSQVYKKFEQAEQYYKLAYKLNPTHSNNNGNFSGFLLATGRKKEAEQYLLAVENVCVNTDLKSELLFYRYAHFEDDQSNSLSKLKALICSGARSIGFNLQDNVDRAIKDGHPEPELLQRLADIITKDEPVGDLCDGVK